MHGGAASLVIDVYTLPFFCFKHNVPAINDFVFQLPGWATCPAQNFGDTDRYKGAKQQEAYL